MTIDERMPGDKCPDWWPYGRQFREWHVWRGVAGRLYARRPRSSPARVVSAKSTDDLRAEIEAEIQYREERWG